MTPPNRIAFLGPEGTFCEAALLTMPAWQAAEHVAAPSVQAAIDAVRAGEVDQALIPIENSVEGSVSITLDELANGKRLVIIDEVALPVRFTLMGRPGVTLDEVSSVASHPHALAQVRSWVDAHLPDAVVIPSLSTAGAAAALLQSPPPFDAAVAPRLAADRYGLPVLADNIGDTEEATTRFVMVRLPGEIPSPTGADKTTLSLYMKQDEPGALLAILTEFAVRGVNLTRIESRPTRKVLGDYFFSVDIEGHVADARVAEALMGLHRVCLDVRFLGSYPRHDGKQPVLREGVTDSDFAEARGWLDRLKGNRT
ncbi:MAG: prephenate dehydratase [Actinomycetales bacterium]|nr:prephenate dehydratase [Actinomycetales bacterium]